MLPQSLVVVSRTSPVVSIRSVRDLFLNSPEILMPNISSSLSNTFPSANDSPLVSIGCSICAKVVWVSAAPAIRPWLTSINYDTLMHVIALRNASRAPLAHQRLTRYAIMSFSDGFLLCCFLRMSTFSVCYPLLVSVCKIILYISEPWSAVFDWRFSNSSCSCITTVLQIQDEIYGYFIRMLVRLAIGETTNNIVEI